MKQRLVIRYRKNFQQSVIIFLVENQEIQDKITEMTRWEGNNYHHLIETRHLLHNNRSSRLGQKFVLTCVRRVTNSYYQFP